MQFRMEAAFIPSDTIVAREIDGEILIVPLVAGIGDLEDDFYSLNETGQEVWRRLDGKHSLAEIVQELAQAYEADPAEVERGVRGLAEELLRREMIAEVA